MNIIYWQEQDRWIKGDRFIRPRIRRIIRPERTQFSGMERVVLNFLKGLQQLGVSYRYNLPTWFLRTNAKVISFGLGRQGVWGINSRTPLIAAIGFPYPWDFPGLCDRYNVVKYLQHSPWALDHVRSSGLYPDEVFGLWPAGIDTEEWFSARPMSTKEIDVLIYNKIHWDKEDRETNLVEPIRRFLDAGKYTWDEIRYGGYTQAEYKRQLSRCKIMVFLSEHETQGLAYQECLSSNVPVFAWNPGLWLDPVRFRYGTPVVPASSVPFFDERCGITFKDFNEFSKSFEFFFEFALRGVYAPRDYVCENLSISKSTQLLLDIYNSI